MSKTTVHINEVISLTVMLLMVIALVAAQADATVAEPSPLDAAMPRVHSEADHFRLEDE